MNTTCRITTLSPLHIGSGKALKYNSEYLNFNSNHNIALIDSQKVLDIIGEKQMYQWINIIEHDQDLKAFLRRFKRNLKAEDIARRVLTYDGFLPANKDLNENIFSNGIPILPGSSLKGAIRTAVFTELLYRNYQNNHIPEAKLKHHNKFSDNTLTKKLLGNDSNHDLMRFIQVSDAAFYDVNTKAEWIRVLNLQRDGWEVKKGSDRLVEVVPAGQSAICHLKLDSLSIKLLNEKSNNQDQLDTNIIEPKSFINILQNHYKYLLETELDFWNENKDTIDELTENYIDSLQKLSAAMDQMDNKKEIIMRSGFGSGWDYMTGMWAKDEELINNNNLWHEIIHAARHKNHPVLDTFPKTRKINGKGIPLGFIKLSFIE